MPAAVAGRIRSSQGCWTCRLRRKKCDEAKPQCGVCGALEITCVYGEKKPAWMDGGAREKAKAAELRTMVKARAGARRDRKWARELERGEGQYGVEDLDGMLSRASVADEGDGGRAERGEGGENGGGYGHDDDDDDDDDASDGHDSPNEAVNLFTSGSDPSNHGTPSTDASPAAAAAAATDAHAGTLLIDDQQERELTQVMMYVDYVFPFLNPFYRPPLLSHGRGWLLVLLTRHRALFHAALSLAAYFFAVALEAAAPGHEACRAHNWDLLVRQQALAVAALRDDMAALDATRRAPGPPDCGRALRAAVACLNAIAHMLAFELGVGNAAGGPAHLDAAAALLDDIVAVHAAVTPAPWHLVLDHLGASGLPSDLAWPGGQRPWMSDQAAFRFVTAQLLWSDVLAATGRGTAPRLQHLHAELLAGPDPGLPMHEFVGVQSWAVLLLGEVAALAAWAKTTSTSPGLTADAELARRARDLEARLEDELRALDAVFPPGTEAGLAQTDPSAAAPGTFPSAPPLSGGPGLSAAHALHTRAYARATLLYLATITSGWTPAHPAIRRHHGALVALLGALPGPLCLRTLVWPFAVAGCLATAEQEPFFRGLVAAMDGLRVFGTIREALQVMTVVWEHRICVGNAGWGLSDCLGVLGHVALLV